MYNRDKFSFRIIELLKSVSFAKQYFAILPFFVNQNVNTIRIHVIRLNILITHLYKKFTLWENFTIRVSTTPFKVRSANFSYTVYITEWARYVKTRNSVTPTLRFVFTCMTTRCQSVARRKALCVMESGLHACIRIRMHAHRGYKHRGVPDELRVPGFWCYRYFSVHPYLSSVRPQRLVRFTVVVRIAFRSVDVQHTCR